MYKLFRIEPKALFISSVIFSVFYSLLLFAINVIANMPDAPISSGKIVGIMSYAVSVPFLVSGVLVAYRAHPSGVFNSLLVGIFAGAFILLHTKLSFGELPPTYKSAAGIFSGVTTSLLLCGAGGVLGSLAKHYIQR